MVGLHILNQSSAAESTGHGAVLAQLVEVRGRAGGGEGARRLRGLRRYLQRTALQGSLDMITSITRRWVLAPSDVLGGSIRSVST